MKKISFFTAVFFLVGLFFGCEDNLTRDETENSILPERFSVDIPEAISRNATTLKSTAVDTLQGNDIYEHLNTFIYIGESAAQIVEEIIGAIGYFGINKPMTLTYISDDDNRTKNLVIRNEVEFESEIWDYELTITDADSEVNSDGGKALQVIWNAHNGGIKGTAILKPYNIDRVKDADAGDAMFRIDYSELGEQGYDASMIVQISGLPVPEPLNAPYAMETLKMFAGRKGNVVDVYGNSNHPNAIFFNGDAGFNWAFVASGNDDNNLGVAEVGLPPSTLDATSRRVILEQYSIYNVFSQQILDIWPLIDETTLNAYLFNTDAPGFFNEGGFVTGGESPNDSYDALLQRIENLTPYNPKSITELTLNFN